MISNKMTKSINHQINREIFSGYLYLSMASYATSIGLNGVANWFKVQLQEEFTHAQRMYLYLNAQGARVILEEIEAPDNNFSSVLDLFEKTLAHEKQVSKMINDLVTLAREEKDYASDTFLQWFVNEQVEEEANPTEIIQRLKLIGKDGNGIFLLDTELAQRTFVIPPDLIGK